MSRPRSNGRTYLRRGALVSDTPGTTLAVFDMSMGESSCAPSQLEVQPGIAVYGAGELVTLGDLEPSVVESGVGPRIVPVWNTTGGFRALVGYRDLVLGADCLLRQIGPEDWRCIPPSFEVWHDFYADPACKVPKDLIFEYGDGYPDSPALDFAGVWNCPKTARAFSRGPQATTYFQLDGGVCFPGSNPIYQNPPAYEVGPEVTFDLYAKLTPTVA